VARSKPLDSEPFPVRHVASVAPRSPEEQWLIEKLWTAQAAGLICAHPKLGKTFLAVELAVAVASGQHALGQFPVCTPGPVLFFGAEDDLPALRGRFQGVAVARGLALEDLPIFLLDVPEIRLDRAAHLASLRATVAAHQPKLLVLDPFVRLANVDENSSAEVSAVLGSLRAIQREFGLALVVVHHMRKASAAFLGHQVRGSGDFAAWYDSALYLTRKNGSLLLSASHRGAPDPDPVRLQLVMEPAPHLALEAQSASVAAAHPQEDPLQAEIMCLLSPSLRPISTVELRETLRRRKADVVSALQALQEAGRVERHKRGWRLRDA
jgi:hypothetical protein